MIHRIRILFLVLLLQPAFLWAENSGSSDQQPVLLLVSIDGFRWNYPEQFSTPAIKKLASRGIRAKALIPVFPTLTFPNHYSIATGLYPQNHGLVANVFPNASRSDWYQYKQAESAQDGTWYGGVPIWIAAHKAGLSTAAFFFPGSEADIQGVRPDRWNPYDKSVPGTQRVKQVLAWLAEPPETRPQMITLYFDDVDDHSHWTGVGSRPARKAISRVDRYIKQLMKEIDRLPNSRQITVVLVSDHGQSSYTHHKAPLVLDEIVDIGGFRPIESGNYVFLYAGQQDEARILQVQEIINNSWDCGHAWRPGDAPADWHIGDNPRFADLLLIPDPGCAVASSRERLQSLSAGDHGWAPEFSDMHGIFIAAGPGIPAGMEIPSIRNVDVYPLMLRQLGLTPDLPLDSDLELWPWLLDGTEPGNQSAPH